MIFGRDKVTTGAGNDIERATQMARRMVTRFGMSDVVGLMAIGDSDQQVFLGREMTQRREVSEHTAQLVDEEVKRILDEAHERAREVLDTERDLLEAIAQALLERETLDRGQVELLARGEKLPPIDEVEAPGDTSDPGGGSGSGHGSEAVTPTEGAEEEGASEDPAGRSAPGDRGEEESPVSTPATHLSRERPDPGPSQG